MRIPVFVSVPSTLSPTQAAAHRLVESLLTANGLEPRTLGRSDYALTFPLREVYAIARHCSGGVILGFEQLRISKGIRRPGTADETTVADVPIPTPWNHLEAGILFGLGLPLLIFREPGVSGGIFDPGTSGSFIHPMPSPESSPQDVNLLIQQWRSAVHEHYYRDTRG
jgi:hypothetical protein